VKKQFFHVVFHELIINSWWVWAACILCFGLYEQGMYRIAKEKKYLETELMQTNERILASTAKQKELQLQLASLSDPAWIELELIQNLGLVPEGYTKIVFETS